MKTRFTLEIFFEKDEDLEFAKEETKRLCELVKQLAPHIELQIKIQKASKICRCELIRNGRTYYVPFHEPTERNSQTLLITNEEIGSQGRAGPERGCLSKPRMEDKAQRGGNSAEITIHEWLHTIAGKTINGRKIPHPHTNACHGFAKPSSKGPDGEDQWHDWYRYMLREE